MADPIALKALSTAKNSMNIIAKSGFVEKNAPVEVLCIDNYSLMTADYVNTDDVKIVIPDGVKLEKGLKVLFKLMPSGSATTRTGKVYEAEEQVELIAECYLVTEYASLGKIHYAFTTDSDSYLFHESASPNTKYGLFSFFTIKQKGNEYTFSMNCTHKPGRDYIGVTGDLVFNASVVFDAPASAYDGLTLWSSTEGSKKRFELSVDDSANATLTDVDTGETIGLGGSGGGLTEERVNELIDTKLGVIENGTY